MLGALVPAALELAGLGSVICSPSPFLPCTGRRRGRRRGRGDSSSWSLSRDGPESSEDSERERRGSSLRWPESSRLSSLASPFSLFSAFSPVPRPRPPRRRRRRFFLGCPSSSVCCSSLSESRSALEDESLLRLVSESLAFSSLLLLSLSPSERPRPPRRRRRRFFLGWSMLSFSSSSPSMGSSTCSACSALRAISSASFWTVASSTSSSGSMAHEPSGEVLSSHSTMLGSGLCPLGDLRRSMAMSLPLPSYA